MSTKFAKKNISNLQAAVTVVVVAKVIADLPSYEKFRHILLAMVW